MPACVYRLIVLEPEIVGYTVAVPGELRLTSTFHRKSGDNVYGRLIFAAIVSVSSCMVYRGRLHSIFFDPRWRGLFVRAGLRILLGAVPMTYAAFVARIDLVAARRSFAPYLTQASCHSILVVARSRNTRKPQASAPYS